MSRHKYGCATTMAGKPCDCGADAPRRSPVHGISTAGATDAAGARTTAPYHSIEHFKLALAWIEQHHQGGIHLVARALLETGHVT